MMTASECSAFCKHHRNSQYGKSRDDKRIYANASTVIYCFGRVTCSGEKENKKITYTQSHIRTLSRGFRLRNYDQIIIFVAISREIHFMYSLGLSAPL